MTVTSFWFLLFLLIGGILYYIVPKRAQWVLLLLLSIIFYVFSATPYTIVFLIASTLIAYFSTIYIAAHPGEASAKTTSIVAVAAILLNVLIWFLLKGSALWIAGFKLIHLFIPGFVVPEALPIAAALGMGYYTAQIIGYILDVLWGGCQAQKNPLKLFLFVCFFPQLTTGPISQYASLSEEIYACHRFSYDNLCLGSQRILWGFFKKLVISDRIAIMVDAIWSDTNGYYGAWICMAVLLYPLEIYTDFSGSVDIALGAAQIFDIKLAENFRSPFFSRTSQEFWQRWHITLGGWARTYIFYPFMKSRAMQKLGKNCKKKFGKRWGKFIPWMISIAVLWAVMGVWHGSPSHILGLSLWYFVIFTLSELFKPVFEKITNACGFKTDTFSWHLFQSIRTYIIYALGCVFFASSGIRQSLFRWHELAKSVVYFRPWTLFDETILATEITWLDINLIIFGILCVLIVDLLSEKYGSARAWLKGQCFGLRWSIWIGLFILILIYGMYGPGYDASVFIYQGF